MDTLTAERLRDLNRAFYEGEGGDEFSAARTAPWSGWRGLLPHLPERGTLSVLDLGCGNGRLYAWLRRARGGKLRYLGVDQSARLLELARARHPAANFVRADLLASEPPRAPLAVPRQEGSGFDLVCLFGVLHHIPAQAERVRMVREAVRRTRPRGVLAMTFWRFDRNPGLWRRRLSDAEVARRGIPPQALQAGDALLPFGTGERARYCHLCSDDEIAELVAVAGGRVRHCYAADGRGGRLNEYVLVERPGDTVTPRDGLG